MSAQVKSGDARLDAKLQAVSRGGANAATRRKLARELGGWAGDAVVPGLAAVARLAAGRLGDAGHQELAELKIPARALRTALRALALRRAPEAETTLLELWSTAAPRSLVRRAALDALLGRVDPLDDQGHEARDFKLGEQASVDALRQLDARLPPYGKIVGALDRGDRIAVSFLAAPERAFDLYGKLLAGPSTREQQDLVATLLLLVPALRANPARWKKALVKLAASTEAGKWPSILVQRAWGSEDPMREADRA